MLPESLQALMALGVSLPFCGLTRLIAGIIDLRVSTPVSTWSVHHAVRGAGQGEELAVLDGAVAQAARRGLPHVRR